ncbi:hypothetical protein D3C86_597060 [compost metagenome]
MAPRLRASAVGRWKAGQFTPAATPKPRLAALPKSAPRSATKPRKPPRSIRGYSSAVATPTSALAAAMFRSAASTSGRRDSKAPASPIGRRAVKGASGLPASSSPSSTGLKPASTAMRYCASRLAVTCTGTLANTVSSSARALARSPSSPRPAATIASVTRRLSRWLSRLARATARRCSAPRSSK